MKTNKKIIQGRFFKINKKITKNIQANYDKIKDWVIDPKGYFIIKVDFRKKIIRVFYCKIIKTKKNSKHDMVAEIAGKTSLEIVNTLIKNKFISTLQHAADMGIELHKAEMALKYKLHYIQDADLKIL